MRTKVQGDKTLTLHRPLQVGDRLVAHGSHGARMEFLLVNVTIGACEEDFAEWEVVQDESEVNTTLDQYFIP